MKEIGLDVLNLATSDDPGSRLAAAILTHTDWRAAELYDAATRPYGPDPIRTLDQFIELVESDGCPDGVDYAQYHAIKHQAYREMREAIETLATATLHDAGWQYRVPSDDD